MLYAIFRLKAASAATISATSAAKSATESTTASTASATVFSSKVRSFIITLHVAHIPHVLTSLPAAKHIQAVDEGGHDVRVDVVVFRVTPSVGIDGAADVRPLSQDVESLDADGGYTFFEEPVTDLCVPDEFVGVHFF